LVVGVFDRFERGLERAVNGAFAKVFRSEVQPVEIAGALRKECDTHAAIMGRDRTIVPNIFTVALSPVDHDRLGEWESALSDELKAAVTAHAEQQRYVFVGSVQVSIERAEDLTTGLFRVDSSTSKPGGGGSEQQGRPVPRPSSSFQSANPAPGARPGNAAGNSPRLPAASAGPSAPGAPSASQSSAGPRSVYPPVGAPPPAPSRLAVPPVAGAPAVGAAGGPAVRDVSPAANGSGADAGGGIGAGSLEDMPFHRAGGQQPVNPTSAPTWAAQAPVQAKPRTVTLDIDGTVHTVGSAVTVLGRGSDADVMIDDAGVSRRHAEIHLLDGSVNVVDLGSTNGTFLNGKKVHNAPVTDGAVVTVGRTRILLRIIPG